MHKHMSVAQTRAQVLGIHLHIACMCQWFVLCVYRMMKQQVERGRCLPAYHDEAVLPCIRISQCLSQYGMHSALILLLFLQKKKGSSC